MFDRRTWFAAAMSVVLCGCGTAAEQFPDYRYRLTVEVETPEGLKTGSSVIQISTRVAGRNSIPTPGVVSHRIKGEAVTVDLGARGKLFALLRSEQEVDWPAYVMFLLAPKPPPTGDNARDFAGNFAAVSAYRGLIELPPTFPDMAHLKDRPARPMLVRFGNIADPKTVSKVDPDGLAASFGAGVNLRRMTVQMTDDPVTIGISKRFKWWGRYIDHHFDGSDASSEDMTNSIISAHLSSGSFSSEFIVR